MGTAVNWEYIPNNPVRAVKMPERTLKRPHGFLSAEEVQRLIEILALRWGRIDLLRGTLLVAETCYSNSVS
jgi:hypothetical protein